MLSVKALKSLYVWPYHEPGLVVKERDAIVSYRDRSQDCDFATYSKR